MPSKGSSLVAPLALREALWAEKALDPASARAYRWQSSKVGQDSGAPSLEASEAGSMLTPVNAPPSTPESFPFSSPSLPQFTASIPPTPRMEWAKDCLGSSSHRQNTSSTCFLPTKKQCFRLSQSCQQYLMAVR